MLADRLRDVVGSVFVTSATLEQTKRSSFAADIPSTTFKGHPISRHADGTATIQDVEVFRSGTFRDSWGEETTWTDDHIRQIADNYAILVSADIFPDVPVRADHSRSVRNVIGYFAGLRAEGSILKADFHITEPEGLEKIERGTFRSVSFEIGMYTTNDNTPYWPVAYGCAYVDIPAVEKLHSAKDDKSLSYFTRADQQESNVPNQPDDRGTPRNQPEPPHVFTIGGKGTSDYAAVQAYIERVEGENVSLTARNGVLEAFAKEQKDAGRKAFVQALVDKKLVLATQQESLEAYALSVKDDAQYEAWTKTFEGAQALSLLAEHGAAGGTTPPDAPAAAAGAPNELELAKEIVKQHELSGMTREQLERTDSFKTVQRYAAAGKS